MVGLDAAGKTTILYKLKLGEIVTTIPTIGESCLQYGDLVCAGDMSGPARQCCHFELGLRRGRMF